MNSKYKKLAKNTGFISIGSFSSKLLSFVFVPFYTYYLTTSEYGVADIIISTTMLLFQVLTLSISEAAMRFPLDEAYEKKDVFITSVSLTILSDLVILCAVPLANILNIGGEVCSLFALYYIPYSLFTLLSYYARGIEKVGIYSICGIISSALVVGLGIVFLAVCNLGLFGFVLSYSISFSLSSLILFLAAHMYRYTGRLSPRWKAIAIEMFHYSIPLVPNGICWWICSSVSLYIIAAFCGTSSTGLYSAALKIPAILLSIIGFFMTAWRISSVDNFGSPASQQFFSKVHRYLLALTVILTAIICLGSQLLGSILFSKDFYEAWVYVSPLCVGALFHGLSDYFGTIYLAAKKTSMMFHSTIAGAATNIISSFVLVPGLGIMGAVIANILGYFVIWLIRSIHSTKIMKFYRNMIKELVGFILLCAESILVVMHLPYYAALLFIVVVVLFYKEIIELSKWVINIFRFR